MSRELAIVIECLRAIHDDLNELLERLDESDRLRKQPDCLVPYCKSRQAMVDAGHSEKDFK
jgi:hypothetical protein